jgi:uncharacterized CHY-type Zn-finger protein
VEDINRECHTCGKSFPHHQMKKVYRPDWDKFIYFCGSCPASISSAREPERTTSHKSHEKTTFAGKYANVKHKKDWWDD